MLLDLQSGYLGDSNHRRHSKMATKIRTNEDPRGLTGKGNAANENTSIHYEQEGRSREEIREYGSRMVHDEAHSYRWLQTRLLQLNKRSTTEGRP